MTETEEVKDPEDPVYKIYGEWAYLETDTPEEKEEIIEYLNLWKKMLLKKLEIQKPAYKFAFSDTITAPANTDNPVTQFPTLGMRVMMDVSAECKS